MENHDIILKLDIIIQYLRKMEIILGSINPNPTSPVKGSDQILNQKDQSDQIRSDQITNFRSDLLNNFSDVCADLGISLKNKDLTNSLRAIQFFFEKPGIKNPKHYILKMLESIPNTRPVGFVPSKHSQSSVPSDIPADNSIFGLPVDVVNDHVKYCTREVYLKCREYIPNYQALFRHWDDVKDTSWKLRLVTAIAIKHDILIESYDHVEDFEL